MELPGAEIPEQETQLEQGAEHNQPADRPAVTRTRLERRQPSYLKDCVKIDLSFVIGLNFARVTSFC